MDPEPAKPAELELVRQPVSVLDSAYEKPEVIRVEPCPWCGSRRIAIEHPSQYFRTHCYDCDTFGPAGSTPQQALSHFNRRASIAVFPKIVALIREQLPHVDESARVELESLLEEVRSYYQFEDETGPIRQKSKWD